MGTATGSGSGSDPAPVAIVTGGNSGIGKETVRGLARAGRRAIAAAPPLRTAARGAEPSLHLALSPEVATVTGRYFDDRTPRKPSAIALDRASQERLWTVSEQLVAQP
jgi:NAD(P)-dependent dehydrogenase (short-subunit alcohol dehydrogenase family)